ncbi:MULTISPECIES: hypothetical protein [unclassified Rhodanobacter]|uniref:hypothetical protein n=1 Tax=unclassified Rhodanobacter TaxID=2621553 RepID=UPI000ACBAE98|nr:MULTISPECIES: hypothetical protein [unclassified Rhodanobacter]
MNLAQLLQIPWYSAHRQLRWMTVLVFALCSAGALALGLLAGRPDAWRGAAMLYGIGLFFVWAFFLPLSLLLAIDARLLRVPGVQCPILASLCLYGALGLGLPLAVLARAGQPLLPATALLALLGTGGLLFALMPRYLAIVIGLTPSLLNGLWRHFDLPGFTDPRTVEVMLLLIPVLLLCCAWRWRQLLRVSNGQASGWSSPMVLQFRNGSWGLWSQVGEQRLLCQRPGWLQPAVDLDDVGPTRPHRALRVALGGWYLPLTLSSHVRQLALLLGIVAVPVLSILLLDYLGPHDRDNTDLLKGSLVGGLGTLGVMAGPMISALSLL